MNLLLSSLDSWLFLMSWWQGKLYYQTYSEHAVLYIFKYFFYRNPLVSESFNFLEFKEKVSEQKLFALILEKAPKKFYQRRLQFYMFKSITKLLETLIKQMPVTISKIVAVKHSRSESES